MRKLMPLLIVSLFTVPLRAQQRLTAPDPYYKIPVAVADNTRVARPLLLPRQKTAYMKAIEKAYRKYPNYLTLNIIRSFRPLRWQNPGALVHDVIANEVREFRGLDRHSIGHVSFEFRCDDMMFPVMGGEDSADFVSYVTKSIQNDAWLGAMFYTVGGMLEKPNEMYEDLSYMTQNKPRQISFLTFRLSKEACASVHNYYNALVRGGVPLNYGMTARPMYKEGANCASLGASFVEAAGVPEYPQFADKWHRTIYVANYMLGKGGKSAAAKRSEVDEYNWLKKPASGKYRTGVIFDPSFMNAWTVGLMTKRIAAPRPYSIYKINKSYGVALDYTDLSAPAQVWWKR